MKRLVASLCFLGAGMGAHAQIATTITSILDPITQSAQLKEIAADALVIGDWAAMVGNIAAFVQLQQQALQSLQQGDFDGIIDAWTDEVAAMGTAITAVGNYSSTYSDYVNNSPYANTNDNYNAQQQISADSQFQQGLLAEQQAYSQQLNVMVNTRNLMKNTTRRATLTQMNIQKAAASGGDPTKVLQIIENQSALTTGEMGDVHQTLESAMEMQTQKDLLNKANEAAQAQLATSEGRQDGAAAFWQNVTDTPDY